jgi:2-dehydro-3-deoxyphosphogluconate aldolase / (4S)-4-hydroxy-2-oxoglutarate aldolase
VEFTLTSRGAVEALRRFAARMPAGVTRAVKAPLSEVPLVPTGGVGLEEIGRYLDADALAVGLGDPLVGRRRGGRGPGALWRRAEAAVA